LRRWWWIYLLISVAGAILFIRNFQARDPYSFAILLLIPLLALRQAWRTDRQISACDHHIRQITSPVVPPLAPASGRVDPAKGRG
jgi:uncharacterized membrane protein